VETIAKGGRARWNIEEGFNEQKTGYELERFCRGKALDLMLNLYGLRPIAHRFMQLRASSALIQYITPQTFLAKRMLEARPNLLLPDELLAPPCRLPDKSGSTKDPPSPHRARVPVSNRSIPPAPDSS